MLQLKLNNKKVAPEMESVAFVEDANVKTEESTNIKGRHYVNLPRAVSDNAPSILEYIDNEISTLNKKISLLQTERECVIRLLEVVTKS